MKKQSVSKTNLKLNNIFMKLHLFFLLFIIQIPTISLGDIIFNEPMNNIGVVFIDEIDLHDNVVKNKSVDKNVDDDPYKDVVLNEFGVQVFEYNKKLWPKVKLTDKAEIVATPGYVEKKYTYKIKDKKETNKSKMNSKFILYYLYFLIILCYIYMMKLIFSRNNLT